MGRRFRERRGADLRAAQGLNRPLTLVRQALNRVDGPWYLRGLFELAGSRRLSRPALHDLDAKLERWLDMDGGVFVEAGAYDGYKQSNTYYLERYGGWSGVLVEPIPALARKCARHRRGARVFNCALVPFDYSAPTVTMIFGEPTSAVKGVRSREQISRGLARTGRRPYEVEVQARTLTAVLDEAEVSRLDLLSLDVEGYEIPVLRGLDFERYAPRFILAELLEFEAMLPEFRDALGARYEHVATLSHHDALFRRADGGWAGPG